MVCSPTPNPSGAKAEATASEYKEAENIFGRTNGLSLTRIRTVRRAVAGFYIVFLAYLGISTTIADTPLGFPAGSFLNGWWLLTFIVLMSVPAFMVIVVEKRQRTLGNAQSPPNTN